MHRRTAVKSLVFISLAGSGLVSCKRDEDVWSKLSLNNLKLSKHHQSMVEVLSRCILPIHKRQGWENILLTPVAMQIIDHCYSKEDIQQFIAGLEEIDKRARLEIHKPFLSCNEMEIVNMLNIWINSEAISPSVATTINTLKKELLHALFTTEKYLRGYRMYEMAPARFKSCLPIDQVTTLHR